MPSHFYAPTQEDKFAFGIWCLQNRGRDPFGDVTRPEMSALDAIRGLAQRNCYGFEFHDNDIIPFGASASQRDQILRDLKKALPDWGIKATERQISIDEVIEAYKAGRLEEVYGTGTAAVISPVGELAYRGEKMTINGGRIGPLTQRLYDAIVGIQYGKNPDPHRWTVEV